MVRNARRIAAFALAIGTFPTHLAIATSPAPNSDVVDSEPTLPPLSIKAVNPGYSVDSVSNTGEFIELVNSTGDVISLYGFSLIYNNGKTDYPLFDFPENSFLSPGSLVLRFDKSPEVKNAEDYASVTNLVYSKELALSGSLRLSYASPPETLSGDDPITDSPLDPLLIDEPSASVVDELSVSPSSTPPTVVDELCWTGKSGCVSAFASKNPTTLVRNFSSGEFEHLAEYAPNFHLENYQIITPPEPEPELDDDALPENPNSSESSGSDTSADPPSGASSSASDSPTPENPLSDTELDPSISADASTVSDGTLAPCPEGKYRNPETNRCKKIEEEPEEKTCADGYYLNPSTNRCNKIKETAEPEQVACAEGYHLNPETNRCNKDVVIAEKTCAEGYHLNPETNRCNKDVVEVEKICEDGYYLNTITNRCNKLPTVKTLEPCADGYERNPETNRCRKIASADSDESDLKPCAEGYERNPETNRCRKITSNTGADFPLVPTTGGVEQKNFVAIWGLIGVGALGAAYVVFQFRTELAHFFKKFFSRLLPKPRK